MRRWSEGDVYYKLTFVRRIDATWIVVTCECGAEKLLLRRHFGWRRSCGCAAKQTPASRRATGQRAGARNRRLGELLDTAILLVIAPTKHYTVSQVHECVAEEFGDAVSYRTVIRSLNRLLVSGMLVDNGEPLRSSKREYMRPHGGNRGEASPEDGDQRDRPLDRARFTYPRTPAGIGNRTRSASP